jgi:hypothetical protein
MGGECYRFVELLRNKHNKETLIPELAKKAYKEIVLPQLVAAVSTWKAKADFEDVKWQVNADVSTGIHIVCADGELVHNIAIICPPALDYSLSVGWRHHRHGRSLDPKYSIAETLMDILLSPRESPQLLRALLCEDEEDKIVDDSFYMDDD